MIACGLGGSLGKRSMITFLGGGGNFLPDIVITLRKIGRGGVGGRSRTIKGSGVMGLHGCWRMIRGGGGGGKMPTDCFINM